MKEIANLYLLIGTFPEDLNTSIFLLPKINMWDFIRTSEYYEQWIQTKAHIQGHDSYMCQLLGPSFQNSKIRT